MATRAAARITYLTGYLTSPNQDEVLYQKLCEWIYHMGLGIVKDEAPKWELVDSRPPTHDPVSSSSEAHKRATAAPQQAKEGIL